MQLTRGITVDVLGVLGDVRAELHEVLAERDALQSMATQMGRESSGKTKLLETNTDAYDIADVWVKNEGES